MHTHTKAWKAYEVRPGTDAERPHATCAEYCLYDDLSNSYGYTSAWVEYLCGKLGDPKEYERVTGVPPIVVEEDWPEGRGSDSA